MIEAREIEKGLEPKQWTQHETLALSQEGKYFQEMLKLVLLHGSDAPSPTEVNPDGSQKRVPVPYSTIIQNAVYVTEEAFKVCKEKGWSVELPSLDQLYNGQSKSKVGF